MTRIYVSDYGSDRNDGLTKQTAIYSWKRAKKLFAGHIEISVDTAMTRKRLMKEIQSQRLLRDSPASRFRMPHSSKGSLSLQDQRQRLRGRTKSVELPVNQPSEEMATNNSVRVMTGRNFIF